MLHSALLKQGLRSKYISQHRFSSLTDSLHSVMAQHAKKDWKSVLVIAKSNDVLQFTERTMSKTSPMWPEERAAIASIFDSAANCEQKNNTRNCIRPFVASGYAKHNLVASIGAEVATRLCYSYSAVPVDTELPTITSAIEDAAIAPNLLLLNLKPPHVQEYLLAGHLHKYLSSIGERNFGLLRHTFNAALDAAPNGVSARVTTRLLLIQLMAAKSNSSEGGASSCLPGQLVAAAVQRVSEAHGAAAGTKLLQEVHKSVGLLPPSGISSLAYTHMLDTLLCKHKSSHRDSTSSIENNANSSTSRRLHSSSDSKPDFHSLVALLRLASGNTAADVALRGDLLKHLTKLNFYQEAVDLAALCVRERRWLGTETLNALLRADTDALHGTGAAVVNSLIHAEHAQLIRLLDQAQSALSAFGAGALILPPALQRVVFMGQVATSNSPARDTPRKARTCSSFELVLSPDEALLVKAGTLDFDALLPPQDLVLGPDCGTLNANVAQIERYFALNPAAHRVTAVRRLLEIIAVLGEKEADLEADMDVLVFIARLGRRARSLLVANKAVELALRLGQLSDSQRAAVGNEAVRYSWQVPGAASRPEQTTVLDGVRAPHAPLVDTANSSSSRTLAAGDETIDSESEQDVTNVLVVGPSQPTLNEMQMLLAAQFAAARHVNNLAVMRACHTESIACGVPVSESMAREALSVFLFWGDHASVSGIFEALEQTQGAQRVTVLAGELLSSLLMQNRLLDAAKVVQIVTGLEHSARQAAPARAGLSLSSTAQDALYAALHALLRHRIEHSESPEAARGLDEGRTALDKGCALEAIVTIVANALDNFDLAQTRSVSVADSAGVASHTLRPVELLLQYFRQQAPRHPQQTAQVIAAVRVAAAQHARGAELLQMISSVTATVASSELGEVNDGVFDSPLKLRASRDRSSRAPFSALPYDALEMHESDADSEADYWPSRREK